MREECCIFAAHWYSRNRRWRLFPFSLIPTTLFFLIIFRIFCVPLPLPFFRTHSKMDGHYLFICIIPKSGMKYNGIQQSPFCLVHTIHDGRLMLVQRLDTSLSTANIIVSYSTSPRQHHHHPLCAEIKQVVSPCLLKQCKSAVLDTAVHHYVFHILFHTYRCTSRLPECEQS